MKTKETNFLGRTTGKFHNRGEKIRNASGHRGENEGHGKNISEQEHKKQNFW